MSAQPVNLNSSENVFFTESQVKCEFELPTFSNQIQESEMITQVGIVQELLPTGDTESDSSVEIETFNINFSKQVPLSFRKHEAREHRNSVHIQPEYDLLQFFPEIILLQAMDVLNTKPSDLPVERTVLRKVNEGDSLPSDICAEISEPLIKPRSASKMTGQSNRELMLTTDVFSNQDTRLVSSQVASGDKLATNAVNLDEIVIKELHTVGSNFTEPEVSRCGDQLEELESTVKQILSEDSLQGNLFEATENCTFNSELKAEVQETPIAETHVNVFSVQPHEETVIELLPRKKTRARNEVQVKSEKCGHSTVSQSPTNIAGFHDVLQQPDLISYIAEPGTAAEMSKVKVVSPTPVPYSDKQHDLGKHSNKSEKSCDALYDCKWPNNYSDELSVLGADCIMPKSSGHSVDDKWSNILSTDPFVHISDDPKEGNYTDLFTNWSTDCIFRSSHAQNDKRAEHKIISVSDFDDDIEDDVFDEDNPRHSLHELEETVSQLVSDVEMDETQLLEHLLCLDKTVVRSSNTSEEDILQSDNFDLEKTMSNTASIQCESPPNQGPLENNRSVRAEIKLLVKTSDTGKEAIEIRSMREYLDTEVAHGQEDISSLFRADLKDSNYMLRNFQEQLNLPQNLESSDRDMSLKLCHSSGCKNYKSIQLSHELQIDPSLNTKIFEGSTIGNDVSNNAECIPLVHDLKQAYSSFPSEHQHHSIEKAILWPHDGKLLDDSETQEKWQQKNTLKCNEQQAKNDEDEYQSVKEESHKHRQEQVMKQHMKENGSDKFEIKIDETEKSAKCHPKIPVVIEGKYIEKVKQPQKSHEMRTTGMCQQKVGHEQSMVEQTCISEHKTKETAETTQAKCQLRKPGHKPEQQEGKEEKRQLQQIQRLFIRSPDFVLSEPLNMLPSDRSSKEQNSSVLDVSSDSKQKSQQIKKLLVRSADSESCKTFPVLYPPSSLPPDLHQILITPSPPPQQLPKTKLFENLSQVPLASEEDLRSSSPLSQNISSQNIFFSFLPRDDLSDISDSSNTYIPPAHCLSMPSLIMSTSSTTGTKSLNGKPLSSSLTRVVSMPLFQDPISPIIPKLHESCVSSSHVTDSEPEVWASLLDNENEPSFITQCSLNSIETNSPSSVADSTFHRSDTTPSFWQSKSSLPRSPSSSRRSFGEKFVSSPSSSLSSFHSEVLMPQRSPSFPIHHGRTSPNIADTVSSDYCPHPTLTSPPRSLLTPRQHRHNQMSHVNTITTCPKTPSSNAQAISDPWYLQTEFLLSPSFIPSGYCTWVPTPNQQTNSRGKKGVDFKMPHFVDR
jgi:hypothetical protein